MEYLKKILDFRKPTQADNCSYNTLWFEYVTEGFHYVYIQRGRTKTKWEFLGFEITKHIEEFWRDEDQFVRQAQFLFNLDEEEVAELKERMPHLN